MDPRLRHALVVAFCAIVAVCAGVQIASGKLFSMDFLGLVSGTAIALSTGAIAVRLFRLPFDVILCGWLLVGYIVGNRGFAQLMPAPGVPLLPAEIGLLVACSWRLIVGAFERRLPFRADPLNWAVLLWLVAGTVRLAFDVPRFGFLAVRDFAMVYYALYFFLVQHMGRDERARCYLLGCAVVGCVLLVPSYALYSAFPDFFLRNLTVHGMPVIFYKGDLLNTFFGIGSLLVFFTARGRWRPFAWVLATGMFVYVAGGENRASLFGLGLACLVLLLARRWKFPALQAATAAAALLLVAGLAAVGDVAWAEKKLAGMADRARSLTDFRGLGRYQSEEAGNKGANNRFRAIWWAKVVEETWTHNPAFGLGFGADLAGAFVREYFPESDEDFSARSPHNFFLTVLGRMGVAGLVVWLLVCGQLARQGWRALRREDPPGWSLWCSLLVLLGSATFGVVLEGPMGAVPFWVLAGLANARWVAPPSTTADAAASPPAQAATVAAT